MAKLIFERYGHKYGHGRTLQANGLRVHVRRAGVGAAGQLIPGQLQRDNTKGGLGLLGGLHSLGKGGGLAELLEEESDGSGEEAADAEQTDASMLAALVLQEQEREEGAAKKPKETTYAKAVKAEDARNKKSRFNTNRNLMAAGEDDHQLEDTAAIGTMLM